MKTCVICSLQNPDDAATCVHCGENSGYIPEPTDSQVLDWDEAPKAKKSREGKK